MEYFKLGDLEQHITESITVDDVKDITTNVLNGLRIMHKENFAHRDLKPSNIFVLEKPPTSNWWVKIGDFGISKRVEGDITAHRTVIGTPAYQAPEINGYLDTDQPTSVYDNAVDIWSLGCVIYKVATQSVPFPRPMDVVSSCNRKLPFPEQPLLTKMGTEGVEFIKSLVAPNPQQRLSAESALEASWLLQRRHDTILKTEEPAEHSVLTTTQTTNANKLTTEVNSLDNKTVTSVSNNETVRLWDSTTGVTQHTLRDHTDHVWAVTFSPDGKTVASTSDDETVRMCDSTTGITRYILKDHMSGVNDVTFSPNGKIVASASDDKTVRLWDSATGTAQYTLKGHLNSITAVAFSPDGKTLISASVDSTIRLWDSMMGTVQGILKGHTSIIWDVIFSPDGKTIASASADETVRLWDSTTETVQHILKGHMNVVTAVAYSPDNKMVTSASCDKTIRIWDCTLGIT